ncbi:MAG: hypothetical protein ABEN55_00555 [Bradymonadaceae bacterium]
MATEKIRVLQPGTKIHGEKRDAGYETEYPVRAANSLAVTGKVMILPPDYSLTDEVNEANNAGETETAERASDGEEAGEGADTRASDSGTEATEGGDAPRGSDTDESAENDEDAGETDESGAVAEIREALESDDWDAIRDAVSEYTDLGVVGLGKDDAVEALESELEERAE